MSELPESSGALRRHTPRRRRSRPTSTATWRYVVALIAVFGVALGVSAHFDTNVDQRFQFSLSGAPLGAAGLSTPSVASSTNQESSWYCTWSLPVGVQSNGAALTLTNASKTTSTVLLYTSLSAKPIRNVSITAWSSVSVPLSSISKTQTGGVTVIAKQGRSLASLSLPYGATEVQSPCQVTPGFYWLANDLSTLSGDQIGLSLYNPFSTDAVVDVYSVTEQGSASPSSYQGLIVPAGSTLRLRTKLLLAPVQSAAIEVRARSGRIVLGAIALRGDVHGSGLTFPLVTTRPSANWIFPYVPTGPGATSTVTIANPSARVVAVDLTLAPYAASNPVSGNSGVTGSSTRLSVEVAPASVSVIPLGSQFKTPPKAAFQVDVTSRNQVGVAVSVGAILPNPSGAPSFSEPATSPLTAANWIVLEPHASTTDTTVFGKLAMRVNGGSGNLVTVSGRLLNAVISHHSREGAISLVQGAQAKEFNVVSSGILEVPPTNGDTVFFVNASSPLSVEPAYSASSAGAFLAVPIRK